MTMEASTSSPTDQNHFWAEERNRYFATELEDADRDIDNLVRREGQRQFDQIELIASENIVSLAVLRAQGSLLSNKTVEGYTGARYHGGAHIVDEVEDLAIERACRLFGTAFCNVQPHSGSQANQAVFKALLKPGDTVLSLDLRAGGHLSHGSKANLSGQVYNIIPYGVRPEDGFIDYENLLDLALKHKPRLIVAGGSSYPRELELQLLRNAASECGAKLLVDMAHFAGLVAGGILADPCSIADVITTTTYKSLRGARGGLILWNDDTLSSKLRAAVFPGIQGSPLLNMVAAKAVGLGEALRPSFRDYASRVQKNARTLCEELMAEGLRVVTNGTDTPLLLVDLRGLSIHGAYASDLLGYAGITCNKNLVPMDPLTPQHTSGLRFGVSAVTTRGLGQDEMRMIGRWIGQLIRSACGAATGTTAIIDAITPQVRDMAHRFPIYPTQ